MTRITAEQSIRQSPVPRARLAGPEIHREPVHARRHAGIGHWRYLLLIGWSVALLGAGLGSYAPAADADFMFMAAFPGPGHVLGLVLRLAAGARHVDGLPVVIASGIAAAVMLAGALILRGDPGDDGGGWDLTIKAVLLDTAADSAAASGVAASGAIILHARGRGWLDPGAALAITVIISYLAQELVRQTVAAIRSP